MELNSKKRDIVSTLKIGKLPIFKQRLCRCGQSLCADYEV